MLLEGCGLPDAWKGAKQWRVLETGFGLGLNFLATWRAWKQDPSRPRMLHFVAIAADPAAASELLAGAAPYPDLFPLAGALADRWFGLVPGVHRLSFEHGQVLLTVHVRGVEETLRREPFTADSVFLEGCASAGDLQTWTLSLLKTVARHCRRGSSLATRCLTAQLRRDLKQCGFDVSPDEGPHSGRECGRASYSPAWEPKVRGRTMSVKPGRCIVVGAGLAGSAVAASLARRGWEVTVLDAAERPAAGASGLPVGLLVPHTSRDDNLLSRVSRCGVRLTLAEARDLLDEALDWSPSGVLERLVQPELAGPVPGAVEGWSRPVDDAIHPSIHATGLWHEQAAWIRPASLVRAWLAHAGIAWRGDARVARIERDGGGWRVGDASGALVAEGDLVVVATAHATATLVDRELSLHPVRGQITWGQRLGNQAMPAFPVNGDGYFVPDFRLHGQRVWACGATFDRDDTDPTVRDRDQQGNLARLRRLLPSVAAQVAGDIEAGRAGAWVGIRCASDTRRPLVGEVDAGLWISTAMGSRGLTFAALCAEVLAARLHDEPLPMEHRLVEALTYHGRTASAS